MSEGAAVATDTSAGVADTGGGGDGGGDSGGSRSPAQVIPSRAAMEGHGGEDDGADAASDNGKVTRPPKPQKHKVKRFGKEIEIGSLEDAAKMLSDDWEDEISVSGQARKAKFSDLVRGYQLSEGSFDRMRKASEIEKGWQEKIEHATKDPEWGLMMMLGVEDPMQFYAQQFKRQMAIDAELKRLYEAGDTYGHQRMMDKLADERKAKRDAFNEHKRKSEAESNQRKERAARNEAAVKQAIEATGLAWNDSVRTIAGNIARKWAEVGNPMAPADIAAMAREEYIGQIKALIGGFDDDGIVNFLGPDIRKRLRQHELAEVRKGAKPAPVTAVPANTNGQRKEPEKGISEAEFMRRARAGR